MKQSGFSLIELLIVILILSITVLFATLSFGDFGQMKKAKMQAQYFIKNIELVRQYAMVVNHEITIDVYEDGFKVQNPFRANLKLFQKKYFTNILALHKTSIAINSLGEIHNFSLTLTTKNNKNSFAIICHDNNLSINEHK